jgi:hypothetical protein
LKIFIEWNALPWGAPITTTGNLPGPIQYVLPHRLAAIGTFAAVGRPAGRNLPPEARHNHSIAMLCRVSE